MSKLLSLDFFERDTIQVSKDLLGCYLEVVTSEGITGGMIVETEAYLQGDAAAHSYVGQTKRNNAVFGVPGNIYIYLIYGMHYCLNFVSNKAGLGEAVLIRAVQPLEGIALMKKRRQREDTHQLCNGPAKLVQAMGITINMNNQLVNEDVIKLYQGKSQTEIISSPRIGITKNAEVEWRFHLENNPFVSR